MRAAPCGGAATRRRTFISWAAWLCVSPSLSLSLSPPPSLSLSSSSRRPLFHPLYFSPSSFSPLPGVNESKKPCALSRVGQWMNEVRWKLIVERSEMSCEGIHGTDWTDSSNFLSPAPSLLILLRFALSLRPCRSILLLLSLPSPLSPRSWHETSISAPWNMERALMNCLQVSSMHANGSRGTGSGFFLFFFF